MHRTHYYDFWRHYRVPGVDFKEARITFSRSLEDRTEDQYYVETTYQFPGADNQHCGITPLARTLFAYAAVVSRILPPRSLPGSCSPKLSEAYGGCKSPPSTRRSPPGHTPV